MTPSGIKPATFRHRVLLYQQWFPLICGQNSTLSGSRHIASCGMLFKTTNQNTTEQPATEINSVFWPGCRTAAAMWQQITFNKHQRTLTLQIAHWRFPLTEHSCNSELLTRHGQRLLLGQRNAKRKHHSSLCRRPQGNIRNTPYAGPKLGDVAGRRRLLSSVTRFRNSPAVYSQ